MYPEQPPQPVDRQIQGVLAQVEQRQAGWMRFHINEPGNNYPTRVDTKKEELVRQAMTMIGQPITAEIREQEATSINPHTGRPYINRYLNAIAPAGYAPGVMPTAPGTPQSPTPQQWTEQQAPQQPAMVQAWQQQQQPLQQAPVQPQAYQESDREIRIMRQTASKVAAEMLDLLPPEQQNMTGMVEVCEAWLAYYIHGPLRFGVQAFSQATPGNSDGDPGPVPEQYESVNAQ